MHVVERLTGLRVVDACVDQAVPGFLVVGRGLVVEVHDFRKMSADALVLLERHIVGQRVAHDEKAPVGRHGVGLLDLDGQAALCLAQVFDMQHAAIVETHRGRIRVSQSRIRRRVVSLDLAARLTLSRRPVGTDADAIAVDDLRAEQRRCTVDLVHRPVDLAVQSRQIGTEEMRISRIELSRVVNREQVRPVVHQQAANGLAGRTRFRRSAGTLC